MSTLEVGPSRQRSADRVTFGHTAGPISVLQVSSFAAASMLLGSVTWVAGAPDTVVAGDGSIRYGVEAPVSSTHANLLTLTGETMDDEDAAAWEDVTFRSSMERSLEQFYAGEVVRNDDLFDVDLDDDER